MRHIYCVMREGSRGIDLDTLARRYCFDDHGEEVGVSIAKRLAVEAINDLGEAVRGFVREFERESKELFGFRIRIESPYTRIVGGSKTVVEPGFWTGVFESANNSDFVTLIILPSIRRYSEMIRFTDDVLSRISKHFRLLSSALRVSSPMLVVIPYLITILLEVERMLLFERKRICEEILSPRGGSRLELSFGYGEQMYLLKDIVCRENKEFMVVIALIVKELIKAVKMVEDVASRVIDVVDRVGLERGYKEVLRGLLNIYFQEFRRLLGIFVSSDFVQQSLGLADVDIDADKLDRYQHLFAAIRRLDKSGFVYTSSKGARVRHMLFPSTKIYELYVFANIVKAFEEPHEYVVPLGVKSKKEGISMYFNNVGGEEGISRIVYPLTGSTPTPDIVVTKDGIVVVVEAKYRRLSYRDGRGRLGLADAERLAAYIVDVARNQKLKAVIASLTIPSPEKLKTIKESVKPIDGKHIDIDFVDVNPDKEVDNSYRLRQTLSQLLSG